MTRPLRRIESPNAVFGWVEPCPFRCGAEYLIPDAAPVVPEDRWDAHLASCPSRPRVVVPTIRPAWHREDDEPAVTVWSYGQGPIRSVRTGPAPAACWCRHDDRAHRRAGCLESDCLCLDPPELVRWAAAHPRG